MTDMFADHLRMLLRWPQSNSGGDLNVKINRRNASLTDIDGVLEDVWIDALIHLNNEGIESRLVSTGSDVDVNGSHRNL